MTLIFTGAFADCVVIGADTLRHHQHNRTPAGNASKIRQINRYVLAAKAGYATDTDAVWDMLESTPGVADMGPNAVAAALKDVGGSAYRECKR